MDAETLEDFLVKDQFKGIDTRGKIILEILCSEKAFCQGLNEVMNTYYNPITKAFTDIDLDTIFINLDEIFDNAVLFVNTLESCVVKKKEHFPSIFLCLPIITYL